MINSIPSPPIWQRQLRQLAFFSLFLLRLHAQAQILLPKAEHYSLPNGLAEWTPLSITQDPSGLVWIATENGLQRFDGYSFLNFNRSPENAYRITHDLLEHISVFQDSLLFIRYRNNYANFGLLNLKTLEHQPIYLNKSSGLSGVVHSYQADADTRYIYVLTTKADSILLFESHQSTFQKVWSLYFPNASSMEELKILALPGGTDFLLDIPTAGLHLVRKGTILKKWKYSTTEDADLPSPVRLLLKDRLGKIWISLKNTNALYSFNPGKQTLIPLTGWKNKGEFSFIHSDDEGNLLLIQTNGKGRFPRAEAITLRYHDGRIQSMDHLLNYTRYPVCVYSRHFNQTIFWGTPLGMKVFQNSYRTFRHYLAKDIEDDQIGTSARGMTQDKHGNIYLCAENAFWYRINAQDGSLDTLVLRDEKTHRNIEYDCSLQVHADTTFIWGTGCDGAGNGLLLRYNPKNELATSFVYPKTLTHFVPVSDEGLLLAAHEKGGSELLFFDFEKHQFTLVHQGTQNPFKQLAINYIFQKQPYLYWICTSEGLFEYNFKTGALSELNPDGRGQLRNFQTAQDAGNGKYWLGTTFGLFLYDPSGKQLRHFSKSDGLPSEWICGVLNDKKGNSWISTYHGLSRFNPHTSTFQNFTIQNGLSSNSLNRYSFLVDKIGTMYIGSANGINVFQPNAITETPPPPPKPVLTRVSWLSESDYTPHSLNAPKELAVINLPPDAAAIDFQFALPVYYKVRDNRFKIRLDSEHEEGEKWIFLENQNHFHFKKIPPGNYVLHILGADPQGNWSLTELSIPIHVAQYFYQSWFFKTLTFLSLVGILFLVYQANWTQKLKIEQLRTRLSSDIHDEVSGLLAGIAMQSELLSMRATDPALRRGVQKITEVSRIAMSKLTDVLWSIDARRDKLEDVLYRMQEDADFILSPLHIDYTFTTVNLPAKLRLNVQKRQDLYFIFKELINNIVKHARATNVHIHLEMNKHTFTLSIQDNGSAKETEGEPNSNGQGLQNIQMRAQRLQATFHTSHKNGWKSKLVIPNLR